MELKELTGTPWNRYGHRRVYVSAGDDKLGWFDPETREIHPASADHHILLEDFSASWDASTNSSRIRTTPARDGRRSNSTNNTTPPTPENIDLSLNQAGSKAGAKAAELLSEKSEWERFTDFWLMRKTDSEAWRRGALGERIVGQRLDRLPDDWKTLHSVPVGNQGSDIDHVVIGPGGVFTINTKNHARVRAQVSPRGIWVGGHSTRYVRNALFESQRASSALGVDVSPIICIIPSVDGHYSHSGDPDGVTVLTDEELVLWLRFRHRSLTQEEVTLIYEKARWSSTWTG